MSKNFLSKLNLDIDINKRNVDLILFTRTLSVLLRAGINIDKSFYILEDQFTGSFSRVITKVRKNIEKGRSLSDSLQEYPRYFNEIYVGMVNVGEQSGTLVDSLLNLADQQEKDMELKRKIKAASLSPSIILACLIGLGVLMSYYILPQLITVFNSFDMKLPLSTQVLLWISEFLNKYLLFIIIGLIIFIIIFNMLLKIKAVKTQWQGFVLGLPIIGRLMQKLNLARFCRILGILLESNVPINQALKITINSISNYAYKKQLRKVLKNIRAGKSLSESIKNVKKNKLFPKIIYQMVNVGEKTGTLGQNLLYLADFNEKDVDNYSKNLTTVIEPVLLIVVGIVVALVAISVISPIYEFISTMSNLV